jgi:hypothetical protein
VICVGAPTFVHAAVAATGAGRRVEISFELDGSAVAASVVFLQHSER